MQSKSFCRTLRVFQVSDRCLRLAARAGRYDSTERHCINCEGYNRLRSENPAVAFGPFCITRDEFLDVKEHRKNLKRDREANAPPLVHAVISRLAHKSGNHPSPVSTNLSSSSQPQQFEQPLDVAILFSDAHGRFLLKIFVLCIYITISCISHAHNLNTPAIPWK